MKRQILQTGRNCYRILPAQRVAFLVDGENYYPAFRSSVIQAQRSLFIIGWDIDSRFRLLRENPADDWPSKLGDFLKAAVEKKPELQAYVLIWDFAAVYLTERELFPAYKLGWSTTPRLRFKMDSAHPTGASHHQKIVVVDNKTAFVGGFDLSKWRWDSSQHAADDSRRMDPDGLPYAPFHDVQMLVEGEIATALGELATQRWFRATEESVDLPPPSPQTTPWPPQVTAVLENVNVAISRTEGAYKDYPEIREIEQLHLDAIAAAEKFIFIENQYFTSWKIAEALAQRLREKTGPEMVLILREHTSNWVERYTMDVMRFRLLKQLREADHFDHLRVYYPFVPHLDATCISIHSKLLIVDDTFIKIGSANISNRSMGLDTECDLAIEDAPDTQTSVAIAQLRNQLLAEHLNTSITTVETVFNKTHSLRRTIEQLNPHSGRHLAHLEGSVPPEQDILLPATAMIDPEQPLDVDHIANTFIPKEQQRPLGTQLLKISLIFTLFVGLIAAWHWTPLAQLTEVHNLVDYIEQFAALPGQSFITIGGVAISTFLGIPVTPLLLALVMILGPIHGVTYTFIGALLSGISGYGVGHGLGHQTLHRFVGSRIHRLSTYLAEQGIIAVVLLRLVPVAPYTLVNLAIGASHITLRNFVLGTLLGMVPGMLMLTFFADRLRNTVNEPSLINIILLSVAILLLLGLGLIIRRWVRQQRQQYDHSNR